MPENPTGPPPGPLSGVLVADFSRVLAGPYATMLLADLGAEVVKVESPDGDETRSWTPPVARTASRPTTWGSTGASARSRWTCATRTTSGWPASSPAGPT